MKITLHVLLSCCSVPIDDYYIINIVGEECVVEEDDKAEEENSLI